MPLVTSNRNVQVEFSGETTFLIVQSALENEASPGESELVTLVAGNNSIVPPAISGAVVTGVSILLPSGNTIIVTLKGIAGDTGFPLHLTDPNSFSLGSTFTGFVLSTPALSADVVGVRLIWS